MYNMMLNCLKPMVKIVGLMLLDTNCDLTTSNHLYKDIRVIGVTQVLYAGRFVCIYHDECTGVANPEACKYIRYCKL
jgi:hypothetical protein